MNTDILRKVWNIMRGRDHRAALSLPQIAGRVGTTNFGDVGSAIRELVDCGQVQHRELRCGDWCIPVFCESDRHREPHDMGRDEMDEQRAWEARRR